MEIVLGGAQFGLQYGVTNENNPLEGELASRILRKAYNADITMVDTARLYGDSEQIVGSCAHPDHKIITKIKIESLSQSVEELINESLDRLNRASVYGVMIHNPDILDGSERAHKIMNDARLLKEAGLIKKFGVSVYEPDHLLAILKQYEFDMVQYPCNVFDQRFLDLKLQSELLSKNIEQYTRSIFLQGLLLSVEKLPDIFADYQSLFKRYFEDIEALGLSPLQSCLSFVASLSQANGVAIKPVIGIAGEEQLDDLISAKSHVRDDVPFTFFSKYANNDLNLIDPRLWRKA